jgi:hypothetical protein
MVCDNHPERASRVCARAADGQCRSKLVCIDRNDGTNDATSPRSE